MGKIGKYVEWLEPDNLLLLAGWARNGLTVEQIAHNIGIKASTLWEWKKKFPKIGEALKKNKELADREVENALYKCAIGYTDEKGKVHEPNITAQIFWLKNRDSLHWRDKNDLEISGNTDISTSVSAARERLKKLNGGVSVTKADTEKKENPSEVNIDAG